MSTQRIKLADGRYCYSGPNCTWHSPNGTAAAKKEMKLAEVAVSQAKTFEELQAAQERLAESKSRYDVTPEGLQKLQAEIDTEDDDIVKDYLVRRREHAEHLADKIEKEQQEKWEASSQTGDIASSFVGFHEKEHTYTEPTFTTIEDQYYPTTVGSNYDPKNSVTDVKRLLKADIKEAVRTGYLPEGVEYHVSANSKDNKISVEARGIPDALTEIPEEERGYSGGWLTPEGKELRSRMKSMVESYNRDSTNSMIDYFNTAYYTSAKIESERDKSWREDETERKATMARTSGLRKELKSVRAASDDTGVMNKYKLDFTKVENTLPNGDRFSTVNGEERVIAVSSGNRITFHNFTGAYITSGNSIAKILREKGNTRLLNRNRI